MTGAHGPALLQALAIVAPGEPLRDGLDRILSAQKGALVVIGDGPEVLNICSGGFLLDAAYSPQRLSELGKMDGAIIVAPDASRIARANVHLVPNPNVPTTETGTRHRTAERVARSIDVPVITVSGSQSVITVYRGDDRHRLQATGRTLDRANQALQTLQGYRARLDRDSAALITLEVEDVVTVRDAVDFLQLTEAMLRIAAEVNEHIIELGGEGRLVKLQLEELLAGVREHRRLVLRDYFHEDVTRPLDEAEEALAHLRIEQLGDDDAVASMLQVAGEHLDLDNSAVPRGYRLLDQLPRLDDEVVESVIGAFGNLQKILRASIDDLVSVAGLTEDRATSLKDGIRRAIEASVLRQHG